MTKSPTAKSKVSSGRLEASWTLLTDWYTNAYKFAFLKCWTSRGDCVSEYDTYCHRKQYPNYQKSIED